MSRINPFFAALEAESHEPVESGWNLAFRQTGLEHMRGPALRIAYSEDWAEGALAAIAELHSIASERKKNELRLNLLEITIADLKSRIQKLISLQTKIVPINTFAPEPYELLKSFNVTVQPTEDDFEVGWYDANIHTGGQNEEEAVSNLKSLILDLFDSFSREPSEKLGPEPKRQLLVMKQFIRKRP